MRRQCPSWWCSRRGCPEHAGRLQVNSLATATNWNKSESNTERTSTRAEWKSRVAGIALAVGAYGPVYPLLGCRFEHDHQYGGISRRKLVAFC
jgi:hypothetical protein